MIYPDDDTGDALRRMEEQGDDLTKPRDIDFSVVFQAESSAEEFAKTLRSQGLTASVYYAEEMEPFGWNVNVVKGMLPSHREISEFENLLRGVAEGLGGHNV
jgi:hypothetical protein